MAETTCTCADLMHVRRYEREVRITNQTADKVMRDALECRDGSIIGDEAYHQICEVIETWRQAMHWLLADVYEVKEQGK